MTITNGDEAFTIQEEQLYERDDDLKGFSTKCKHDYWMVELLFVPKFLNKRKIKKIIKCRPGGDYCIESYNNLSKNENEVLLSKENYKIVKLIWDNMNIEKNYRKEAVIESFAIRFSYECYQSLVLELDDEPPIDEIYYILAEIPKYFDKYKNEIYERAREILRDKYNVANLI